MSWSGGAADDDGAIVARHRPETMQVRRLFHPVAILMFSALMTAPVPVAGQSVSPPIVEYRGDKARGSFIVGNQTLYPLTVVLQPKGFQVDEEGDLSDVPLDTAIVALKLSTLSFRLQPRQSYTVYYEVKADTVPYWFNIWSGITGSKTESGINLRIELPHVVYLNQKEKLKEADVAIEWVHYLPIDKQIVVAFKNASPRLGRVQSVTASADKAKSQEAAGFPLFPGSVRRMRMPWPDSLPPQRIEARFDGFRLSSSDIVRDTTAARPAAADSMAQGTRAPAARDSSATR